MSNPDGNGGFGDNPENINRTGANAYWCQMKTILQRLANLSPDEFNNYQPKTMKEKIAMKMLEKEDYKEVFDRIDGKAKQTIENIGENKTVLTFEKVASAKRDDDT